jgi:hypothetical protein
MITGALVLGLSLLDAALYLWTRPRLSPWQHRYLLSWIGQGFMTGAWLTYQSFR